MDQDLTLYCLIASLCILAIIIFLIKKSMSPSPLLSKTMETELREI